MGMKFGLLMMLKSMETIKQIFLWLLVVLAPIDLMHAQVIIGDTSTSLATVLDVNAQNSSGGFGGFLMPVVTEAQQALIPVSMSDNSDDGLMVYVSDPLTGKRCWEVYDAYAQAWRSIYCPSECNDILFTENFQSYLADTGVTGLSSSNGDYPAGVSKWTLTSFDSFGSNTPALPGLLIDANDYGLVQGGELVIKDTNGAFRFETQNINITGYTNIVVSMDLRESGPLEYDVALHTTDFNCGNTQSDYIDIEISTDGGSSFIEVPNFSTYGNANHTIADNFSGTIAFNLSSITGTSLVIRVRTQNWADDEYFYIDNIVVRCN